MEGNTNTGVDSAVSVPPLSRIPPSSSSSIEPSSVIAKTGNNTSRKRGPQLLGPTKSESLKMERDRRLKMAQMFTQLQTTVPGVFPQVKNQYLNLHIMSFLSFGYMGLLGFSLFNVKCQYLIHPFYLFEMGLFCVLVFVTCYY